VVVAAGSADAQPARVGLLHAARLHGATARRTVRRYGFHPLRVAHRLDERPVFVVGSPRSGTSFTAVALGGVSGFADLGEVNALKSALPQLVEAPVADAAARARRILERAQRFGMVAGLRMIEQTPEATFAIPALALAYPEARFVHLQRDGRDVVSSLIASGWLRPGRTGSTRDDAGQPYGEHARFWVEPERRDEFAAASEATRCAWAWRRYEGAAQSLLGDLPERSLHLRYEQLVLDPGEHAARVAGFLGTTDRTGEIQREFGSAFATSVGRYGRDLSASDLDDVEREAGDMLRSLGFLASAG
jgi:Sulfotransferase family